MSKWADIGRLTKRFRGDANIPDSAFTMYEYAERYGLGRRAAEDHLKKLVQEGGLLTGMKSTKRGGSWPRMRFYWVPKEPEARDVVGDRRRRRGRGLGGSAR